MSTITTRLGGWVRMLKSDKPVEIDIGEQPRRGFWSRVSGSRRDAAVEELTRGYSEVLALTRAMRDHMDGQAEYNRNMLALLQRLPDALGSLPETNRNQTRMLEALQTHFDHQGRQTQKLNEAITTLATASEQQTQVLGLMQRQIETSREVEQQRFDGLVAMNSALSHVSASTEASIQTMGKICESHGRSDQRMEELMTRSTRYMTALTAMMVGSGVLTALAVGAATYALMLIARGV